MQQEMRQKLDERAHLLKEIAVLQGNLADVESEINALVANQLAEIRKLQAKEFGAVNVTVDGVKFTETIPKKVKWDQPTMCELFTKILAHGDNPANYMKVEISVPEKIYDAFSPEILAMFEPARMVEKGKPTLKIEEVA